MFVYFLLILVVLSFLHLWAMRLEYSPNPPERPGTKLLEQPWARRLLPGCWTFFHLWFVYSLLLKPLLALHAGWQSPPLLETLGDVLFLLVLLVLSAAYAAWHLPRLIRKGIVWKLRLYHAIYGIPSLALLLGLSFFIVKSAGNSFVPDF